MAGEEPRGLSANGGRDLLRVRPDLRATATAAVGGTLVVWWPAFTFGAYGAIFFDVPALWAVATAVFLSGLVPHGRAALPGSSV
jgi:hypothetical protein